MKTTLLILCLLFSGQAFGKFYKFHQLRLKDYEEMKSMAYMHMERFHELNDSESNSTDQDAVNALREAMQLILSRPDNGSDGNMVSKLNDDLGIEKNLKLYNAYWDTMHSIAGEALHFIQKDDMQVDHRATNIYVLINVMSQARPYLEDESEARTLFEKIKEADIEIPKAIEKNFRKRMQSVPESPSIIAERVLADTFPNEYKNKKSKSLWETIKGWFS